VTCGPADEGVTRTAAGYNGAMTCPNFGALCGDVLRYAGCVHQRPLLLLVHVRVLAYGYPRVFVARRSSSVAAQVTAAPWPFPQATPTPSASSTRAAAPSVSPAGVSPSAGAGSPGPQSSRSAGVSAVTFSSAAAVATVIVSLMTLCRRSDA